MEKTHIFALIGVTLLGVVIVFGVLPTFGVLICTPNCNTGSSTSTTSSTIQTTSSTQALSTLYCSISASSTGGVAPWSGTLTALASGGDTPYSYKWTLGTQFSFYNPVSLTFNSAGNYIVYLTVTDPGGQSCDRSVTISVSAPATSSSSQTSATSTTSQTTTTSSGSFSVEIVTMPSPASGLVPLNVGFTVLASGATSYSCQWIFGDGGSSNSCTPSHVYQGPGAFVVQLSATDQAGQTASNSIVIQAFSSSTTTSSSTVKSTITTTSSFITTNSLGQTTTMTSRFVYPSGTNPSWPSGLQPNWAVGNVSVFSEKLSVPIFLQNANVSDIQSTVPISSISYNSSVVQIQFSQSGPVSVTLLSSKLPSAIYADNQKISTWTYSNGILTINADPSYLTIFYPTVSQGFGSTEIILVAMLVVIVVALVSALVYRRSK